jgi:signal transduction histidine kinase
MPVTPVALEAGRAMRAVAQALAPAAAERGLRLEVEVPPDLPAGLADPDLLDRVLQNLIGNAVKYTPAGGRVTVAARADEAGLVLTVADTGPGLPPQIRPRLFQKFVRGPGPLQGSGLGLAFCKLAVEAMGGRIWVESEAGRGAVFHFTIPAAPAPEWQSPLSQS